MVTESDRAKGLLPSGTLPLCYVTLCHYVALYHYVTLYHYDSLSLCHYFKLCHYVTLCQYVTMAEPLLEVNYEVKYE